MKGTTCAVCGEAFIPEAWQRDRGMLLCPKHLNGKTGDPRDTAEARRVRDEVLRDSPPCHWCGRRATTVDHYPIPIIEGGSIDRSNTVPACGSCNKSRGARPGPPRGILDRIRTEGVHGTGTLTEEDMYRTMRQFKRLT